MTNTDPTWVCVSELPRGVGDLEVPPKALNVAGTLGEEPRVALVGTRRASVAALRFTEELAEQLARSGVTVLSGGALGIDAAAHRGALAGGGRTIVVAPSGMDRPFPLENAALFRDILVGGGAYVSLVARDVPATRGAFFRRNAVLVALSQVVVLVEAPWRSGARNAAAQARKLGRPLLVVPSAPWHSQGAGCVGELKLGALPIDSVRDIWKVLPTSLVPQAPPNEPPGPVAKSRLLACELGPVAADMPEDRSVLRACRGGARHLDEVCHQTQLATPIVQRVLLRLTLGGALKLDGAGQITCVP